MPMNPRLLRPLARSGDSDVRAYIAAVEAADQQALEQGVKDAFRDFIVGCKADGIWSAIKASCILMGARTLSGALTPLVGTAPTNNGPFVSGDYDRETGLLGNGTSKYLASGRASNADPQNSQHVCAYASAVPGSPVTSQSLCGAGGTGTGATNIGMTLSGIPSQAVMFYRSQSATSDSATAAATYPTGFHGISRSVSGSYVSRASGANTTRTRTSETPTADGMFIFARNGGGTPASYTSSRLAFYSIGESLDLALLDTRVSTLYTAIGAAI